MLRSLNVRLLLSYTVVILVCLALVGLGLLLFLRTSPLWTSAVFLRLEAAARATLPDVDWRKVVTGDFASLAEAAERQDVRILLVDGAETVVFDSGSAWEGQQLGDVRRAQAQRPHIRGTFVAPGGVRWAFVGETIPGPATERQMLAFVSRQGRVVLLAWFAENLLPPVLQAGLVSLVLSILLALLISRSVAAPLRRVAAAAEAIARGEANTRAPVSGPTEVRALARSFNTMAEQVEAGQQSQRDLVANVSHELKTPLTSIQGFSQALLDGTASTPEATARAVRVINDEAQRMRRMVDELLTLARFDAGQIVMAQDPVEIAPLLRDCVEKLAPQAEAAEVTLALDVPDRLVVTGDADRLAQVFANLLDNAVAHTPAGGRVAAGACLQESQQRAVEVTVTVTDTGEGIPPKALARIFERFYQVDKARRHSRGSGLGLAITREIVEAHGGAITVESVMGLGTKFSVRLPAREGSTATTAVSRRTWHRRGSRQDQGPSEG